MGMQGNLRDMAIADLIQHNCQDRKTAQLKIEHSGQQAILYFEDGNVSHATLGEKSGEAVVYEILQWEDGIFDLETGIKPPKISITRTWSGLLLEGARRLDEIEFKDNLVSPEQDNNPEVYKMINLDEILKEMSGEVTGYIACSLIGLDGFILASNASTNIADQETFGAQMTILLKLVDGSVEKLGAGVVEDNLITTENAYMLMRFLPEKQYFLCIIVDRKTGNLGNMRLISKIYSERLSKAMIRFNITPG
jgi:predicted regulator of Ras-like GTPase activity (Roadblock/LC7/MglB family)